MPAAYIGLAIWWMKFYLNFSAFNIATSPSCKPLATIEERHHKNNEISFWRFFRQD